MIKPVLLTVDDDPGVSRAVARDLRRRYGENYRVVRADSAAQALEALRELKLRGEPVAAMPQISSEPWPSCQTSVITPQAAPTDSTFSTIAFAGPFSTQRLQPLRKRGQLVLDTVDLDPVLALLRDLPHGRQAPGRSADR